MGRPKKEKPNKQGLYEVKVTIGKNFDGTLIRKSFYSTISKADAKAKAEQYKIEQAVFETTGEKISTSNVTFETWARKVLESIRGTIKDSSFNLTYKNSIENHLIPHFGKHRISDIKQIDIQQYFNNKGKEYTIETLKKHKMALNRIFESAVMNDICIKNPCCSIKLTSEIQSEKKRIYTKEQCEYVLSYAKIHRFGLEIHLMLTYGISRSELLGIMWDDIDFDNHILYIRRGVTDVQNTKTGKMELFIGEPKNDFRKRDIPLYSETIKLLENNINESKYVICNNKNNVCSPRTWSRRHFDVFMDNMHLYFLEQGIDIPMLNSHELRHTRASIWVNDGENIFAVADVLGHSDLKMLRKRYAHSDVESTRKLLKID